MSDHITLPNDTFDVPENVSAVFNHFLTCELTTIGKSGLPITWPVMPLYWEQRNQFVILTSIGLPQKAYNIRRNPQVSMLFSDPTGSGLVDPPTVLVQGNAQTPDKIISAFDGLEPELLELIMMQAMKMIERQPAMKLYTSNPLSRYLMDWYFMRLIVTITPHTIQWWGEDELVTGSYPRLTEGQEVSYVG